MNIYRRISQWINESVHEVTGWLCPISSDLGPRMPARETIPGSEDQLSSPRCSDSVNGCLIILKNQFCWLWPLNQELNGGHNMLRAPWCVVHC